MQPSNLAAKWERLRGLAAARPEWHAALKEAKVGTLGVQLTYSADRYSRLEYLLHTTTATHGGGHKAAAAAGHSTLSTTAEGGDSAGNARCEKLYLVLGQTAGAFEARYPGFRAWAEARGSTKASGAGGNGMEQAV
jgi:hypothetical protein